MLRAPKGGVLVFVIRREVRCACMEVASGVTGAVVHCLQGLLQENVNCIGNGKEWTMVDCVSNCSWLEIVGLKDHSLDRR